MIFVYLLALRRRMLSPIHVYNVYDKSLTYGPKENQQPR
jgi:hypothetical protein